VCECGVHTFGGLNWYQQQNVPITKDKIKQIKSKGKHDCLSVIRAVPLSLGAGGEVRTVGLAPSGGNLMQRITLLFRKGSFQKQAIGPYSKPHTDSLFHSLSILCVCSFVYIFENCFATHGP
jgi:hypothetical protein